MKNNILTPKQALNKAYKKVTVHRKDFDKFKISLSNLLKNIDPKEGEDNNKSHLKDFLDDTYYRGKHLINVKNKTDLVIYLENKQESKSGVLFEVKRPGNKSEMISKSNLNNKALHELVLYYLNERTNDKNDEVKYLIATNIFEWFIFDAVIFENIFYKNKEFLKNYNNWKNDLKVSSNTSHFYDEIARPYIAKIKNEISYTQFNLNDFKILLDKADKDSEKKLIPLYKILSPIHLLKQPFANDSNSLDKNFYNELLHLIGLEEVKDKNKKIIRRKEKDNRNSGSLIENAIQILTTDNALEKILDVNKYGTTKDEQYFNVALELTLTWINRILFLKLLESQLFDYNKNASYKFLDSKTIKDYDELYKLFHQVLAVKLKDRTREINKKFKLVPYLNSSLFEITDLENITLKINSLDDSASVDLYTGTVLKENGGRKKTGKLITLHYLFEFLEAYNFTSEGKEEIEDEKKTLINASVLGLIFEKINGYKDGSYFTPGFITMYMSKESIRRAVIQKFNESYNWECDSFDDLHNHLADKRKTSDIIKANSVINSLKICDPAVGSGHFLVSCLNEIISVKSELGILADENGRVLKGYEAHVENDELIISFNEGEEIFEYNTPLKSKTKTETQRVQETLFREKQTIIENCLFGVDINPNSVSIARLRLWIELLKNAFYTQASDYTELETLPNIDINIKEGNSLVSKFGVTQDLFTGADRSAFDVYRLNVNQYKNEHDRDKRKQLKVAIDKTKERIKGIAVNPVKELDDKISDMAEKLHELNITDMFEDQKSKAELEKIEKKKSDLSEKLNKLLSERKIKIDAYNLLYSKPFEWRFEFPEVLDAEGRFIGFDIVIGNPPYIPLEEMSGEEREYYPDKYKYLDRKYDSSVIFLILGFNISNKSSNYCYIAPQTWQTGENYSYFRKYIFENKYVDRIINLPFNIFIDAYVDTAIYLFNNTQNSFYNIFSYNKKIKLQSLDNIEFKNINTEQILDPKYKIIINVIASRILKRLDADKFDQLGNLTISTQGLSASNFNAAITPKDKDKYKLLTAGNVYNYYVNIEETKLITLSDKEQLKKYYASKPKILIRRIINRQDRLSVAYFDKKLVFKKDINPFIPLNNSISAKFLQGIMASKLISYLYVNTSLLATKDDFRQTTLAELREIPIPIVKDKTSNKIIDLVDKILELKLNNSESNTSKLENEIDQIVYKLYGLTQEEIKIVEGGYN